MSRVAMLCIAAMVAARQQANVLMPYASRTGPKFLQKPNFTAVAPSAFFRSRLGKIAWHIQVTELKLVEARKSSLVDCGL